MGSKNNIAKRKKRHAAQKAQTLTRVKVNQAIQLIQHEINGLKNNIAKLQPYADEGCKKAHDSIARKVTTVRTKSRKLAELRAIIRVQLRGTSRVQRQHTELRS